VARGVGAAVVAHGTRAATVVPGARGGGGGTWDQGGGGAWGPMAKAAVGKAGLGCARGRAVGRREVVWKEIVVGGEGAWADF
jgi:hypothetical protein